METAIATIIVALISLVGTLGGSYLSNKKTKAIMEYRMDTMEEKIDKVNDLVECTYKLNTRLTVVEEKIKNIKEEKKNA